MIFSSLLGIQTKYRGLELDYIETKKQIQTTDKLEGCSLHSLNYCSYIKHKTSNPGQDKGLNTNIPLHTTIATQRHLLCTCLMGGLAVLSLSLSLLLPCDLNLKQCVSCLLSEKWSLFNWTFGQFHLWNYMIIYELGENPQIHLPHFSYLLHMLETTKRTSNF